MIEIITLELNFSTKGFTDILDITDDIDAVIKKHNFRRGHALIFVPGSTAALTTIEYEPGLRRDLKEFFEAWIPMNKPYHHDKTWHDGNGYAHLRAAMLKPSLIIPVENGKLLLGTWQQIILVDFDNRPRSRKIVIQLSGEAGGI